jgi:hypothetical protein
MLLGLMIALSPWFSTDTGQNLAGADHGTVVINTLTVGILVFGLSQLQYLALQRWEEVAEIFLGLWLIISPYMFGYSGDGTLRFWHTSLGGVVVLLAALQLWQDWELSEQEMARHGQ